ncbi:MAG: DUF4007 family protein [Pseudomonadota bacterium]
MAKGASAIIDSISTHTQTEDGFLTVFFHGSFGLNRKRMARLLKIGLENSSYRDKDLAASFGYGAPFASAYRSWLHKVGIIELRFPITLTAFGEVIWEKDPEIKTKAALQFLNQELTDESQKAEAWYFFAGEFRETNLRFAKDDLTRALIMRLSAHDATHFGPDSKMIPVIVRKLLECYTSEAALGSLGVLTSRGDDAFEFATDVRSPQFHSPSELEAAMA